MKLGRSFSDAFKKSALKENEKLKLKKELRKEIIKLIKIGLLIIVKEVTQSPHLPCYIFLIIVLARSSKNQP